MLKRYAPLLPLALGFLLVACAGNPPTPSPHASSQNSRVVSAKAPAHAPAAQKSRAAQDEQDYSSSDSLVIDDEQVLPTAAPDILARGLSLVGTRYRYGGSSVSAGFDCSGFIGYLFKREAELKLPRSTREMIKIDAPLVARSELEPGDLLFFSTNGRGRASHAGIYLGDDQFIHSSSSRSGGVRVDSLDSGYWNRTFIEAKRALAMAPNVQATLQR
ncbi:MAG: C40 family peptidase [Pseudomonas sp.]